MGIKIANTAAFAIMILMNYFANAIPLNGNTTGELSARYPNLFVPAGITFSIWGVIYLLLLGFCVVQFMSQYRQMADSIGWFFVVSCILNSLWIVAWHYERPGLSLVIMLFLLFSLIIINQRLVPFGRGITGAAFGLYLGWICIATIANATALLVKLNWPAWGIPDESWAIIMILAGTAITLFLLKTYRNPYTGIAVIWAIAGIILARWPEYRTISAVAGLAIFVLLFFTSYPLLYRQP